MPFPHQQADIACEDFQHLEDLATAYWYSEVLFAALEMNVFGMLGERPLSLDELAGETYRESEGLSRFLGTLVSLQLLIEHGGEYENSPLAARYLVPDQPEYMGDFLMYRRYFAPHWSRLGMRIRQGVSANDRPIPESLEGYGERVFNYVRAMDRQARLKAEEAGDHLESLIHHVPRRILDVGGGAGAWCRTLADRFPHAHAVLVDLPEVISAARALHPDISRWERIETVAANVLKPCIVDASFDLIVLSNILHAYGTDEAASIIRQAAECLTPQGTLLIHDYLTDGQSPHSVKGRLYDLHMMLNTYNGRIYNLGELQQMLDVTGLKNTLSFDLRSDTSIVLARREQPESHRRHSRKDMLLAHARQSGFQWAGIIQTDEVVVAPWVRLKCRFGCSHYGSSLVCPPFSPDEKQMRDLLSAYTHGLLVQGEPPAGRFHEGLLTLERKLFLGGHPEALAFGAGPCSVCPDCDVAGRCRFPAKARPSLEACGVDVYDTVRKAGIVLEPAQHPLSYVKYVGLVLFKEGG